jgi:hypothetical protein
LPDATHVVCDPGGGAGGQLADVADVCEAEVADAAFDADAAFVCDESAAPAPGSDVTVTIPATASTIPNRAAIERRLNVNIPGPLRTIYRYLYK